MSAAPDLKGLALRMFRGGSRVTCDPAPTDTDDDWIVLANPDGMEALDTMLIGDGWEAGGSDIPDNANTTPEADRFISYTMGDLNLICTTSRVFYDRFRAATAVAQRFNLMGKNDRVALFQAVLYGNVCHHVHEHGPQVDEEARASMMPDDFFS